MSTQPRTTAEHFNVVHSDSEEEETAGRRGHAAKRIKPAREKQQSQKAQGKKVVKPPKQHMSKPLDAAIYKGKKRKKGTPTGTQKSADNVMKAYAAIKRAMEKTWAMAPKAPMNQRPCKNDTSKSRTQYIIRKAAITIAASGAAGYASALANDEINRFNLRNGDEKALPLEKQSAPWMPGVTAGARMMLMQYLTSYAQMSLNYARFVRIGARKKTISAEFMREGFERANAHFSDDSAETVFFSQRMSQEKQDKKKKFHTSLLQAGGAATDATETS